MVKVSVIIPVYNTEKYLRKCLDSVCHQTLKDIEIICVNDCSPDNSLEILREYAANDNRIKIIDFVENKGAAAARNAGIEQAQGEYLGFVDSDDFIDLDFYEKLYNKAIETGADAVKGNYKYFPSGIIPYFLNEKIKEDKNNFAFAYCSAIFKKSIVIDNDIRFPNLLDMEDPVFTFNFALFCNRVEFVDSYINITIRENSQTRVKISMERLKDRLTGLNLILDLANEAHNLSINSYSFVLTFWFFQTFVNSLNCDESNIRLYLIKNLIDIYKNVKYDFPCYNELYKFSPLLADSLKNEKVKIMEDFERNNSLFMIRNKIKNKIKVSVIVPVYNAELYIGRCLNSLIHQTLDQIEIICINDCSIDKSLNILNDYAQIYKNIKIINMDVNCGESKARNTGINEAKGEYLAFVDNDDYIDCDFLEKLYNRAKENNADIVKAEVDIVDYNNCHIKEGYHDINKRITETNDKMYFSLYWWTAIYKTKMIKDNGISLPEDLILGGDIVFLNEAVIKANMVSIVSNTFYHWIRRENSGDSKILSDNKVLSVLKAYKKVLSSLNDLTLIKKDSYLFVYNMFMYGIFETIYKNSNSNLIEMCIDDLLLMYKQCLYKEDFISLFLPKYKIISEELKQLNRSKLREYFTKYDTLNKLMFASLRNNIRM